MIKSHILFSAQFRNRFSEKLMELGNIVAGVMVFGPLLSKQDFSLNVLFVGIFIAIMCYGIAYFVSS